MSRKELFSVQIPREMADEISELLETKQLKALGLSSIRAFVLWAVREKLLKLRPILSEHRLQKQLISGEIEVTHE